MADRYQDTTFSGRRSLIAARHGAPAQGESDPLAELARLIGQTDPFGAAAKPRHIRCSRGRSPRATIRRRRARRTRTTCAAGPPPWMQRARQERMPRPPPRNTTPQPEYQPAAVHPLHRYAAQPHASAPRLRSAAAIRPPSRRPIQSRYDDALYGQLESGAAAICQRDPAYPDDPYAYQAATRKSRAAAGAAAA